MADNGRNISALAILWLLLIQGMLFGLAGTHYLGIAWNRYLTWAMYGGLFFLGWVVAWRKRSDLTGWVWIDLLFFTWLAWLMCSLAYYREPIGIWWAKYVPVFVLLPYVLGRVAGIDDIKAYQRLLIIAGIAILPFMAFDHFVSGDLRQSARWTYFGYNHAPLLIGSLLASATIATMAVGKDERRIYILLVIFVLGTVWVGGRGWVMAGVLASIFVLVLGISVGYFHLPLAAKRATALLVALAIGMASLSSQMQEFYGKVFEWSLPRGQVEEETHAPVLGEIHAPVLGKDSCEPIEKGTDSVAMRLLLYREAIEIFRLHPLVGVGAGRYGLFSCSGNMGFPHSTILQAAAELGMPGAVLLLIMLIMPVWVFMKGMVYDGCYLFLCGVWGLYGMAEQLYGNYFISPVGYLLLGISAAFWKRVNDGRA